MHATLLIRCHCECQRVGAKSAGPMQRASAQDITSSFSNPIGEHKNLEIASLARCAPRNDGLGKRLLPTHTAAFPP